MSIISDVTFSYSGIITFNSEPTLWNGSLIYTGDFFTF